MSLEKYLIEYCSPTLASLKTANMFSLMVGDEQDSELQLELANVNQWLSEKGLFLTQLRRRGNRTLLYMGRKSHLERDLKRPETGDFLAGYGYENLALEAVFNQLKNRMEESEDFPHEIGVFLGYPLDDVIGFIENAGKNCKCSGIWKVYSDEQEAQRLFARFTRCRNVYTRLWNQGRPIWNLTVAA